MADAFQEIHDGTLLNGADCGLDPEKSDRFPDAAARAMQHVHNICVERGATCRKPAKAAAAVGDIIRKAGDVEAVMTAQEVEKQRKAILSEVLARPVRAVHGAVGHRGLTAGLAEIAKRRQQR